MSVDQKHDPPDHLGAAGLAFWRKITTDYQLEPQDLARLEIAADCLDRIQQARAVLSRKLDRLAMCAWRDSAKVFLATIKAMGIDE